MRVHVSSDQIEEGFKDAKTAPLYAESAGLLAQGRMPVEMLQAMSLRPEILNAIAATAAGIYPGGLLERPLKERVILDASRANECQFSTDSHLDLMQRLGIVDDPVKSIHDDGLTERERLALAYTHAAMRDSNNVSDSLFERLKHVFTEPEIVELTMLIGYITMLNMFNNCLQLKYHGEYGETEAIAGT